jgi:hypothetical protein
VPPAVKVEAAVKIAGLNRRRQGALLAIAKPPDATGVLLGPRSHRRFALKIICEAGVLLLLIESSL